MPSPPVSCADHLETLKDLFGTQRIRVEASRVVVGERFYPILDGVIVLLDPSH